MEESSVPPIDPDFEPQSRPRSCTWPLPRPDISAVKAEGADGSESAAGTPPADEDKQEPQQIISEPEKVAASEGGVVAGVGGATPRKGSSRRNAWGNQSYADLISQAIENSPEKRLTLAQIYDWMVKTVPYFKDKGDSNSSAGWKNSIRHNLSLHNKFLRVHNESTGKSSWWMLNPEGGKTGKAPRRRAASMDNSSKLLKSRMRAKQTKKQASAAGLGGAGGAPSSRGSLDDPDMWTSFRPRTSSNASTLSGRLSPIATGQEEEDDLPEEGLLSSYSTGSLPPTLTETLMEELDLIDGLTLMTGQQGGASPSTSSVSQCGPNNTKPSNFGNSLFNPMSGSGSCGSGHYGTHVPSSLEALLTSDSPPPSDVMMTQVDPLMPSPGGVGLMGLGTAMVAGRPKPNQLMLGKGLEPNTVPAVGPPHHGGSIASANPSGNLQGMGQFGAPSCFLPSQDRLPTDLDIDMFTENLDCDVDYIINSDLMEDGIDFNFDPILPGSQGYTGPPATTQSSAHNWVPS
uniref:Forkhead box O4 n=1 Tax=Myripristis murdjan TaxID=586833 RepID=A0A667Z6U7_9TELE